MRQWLLPLILSSSAWAADPSALPTPATAAPPPVLVELKSGKITYMERAGVKIAGASGSAKVGDILDEKTSLETGSSPVTEITFADGSVMRLGEKTKVSFSSQERSFRLESGTILVYSPEGHGGISILGGDSVGQVAGSTVMGTRDSAGNFSMFVLESSDAGSLSSPNAPPTFLGSGEGATIRSAAGETPEVMDVYIDAVRDISPLFQQIPNALPSSEKVVAATYRQAEEIQGDVKLLSSLENYKLTQTDPEAVALAMICSVGSDEMGAAKNILLRPLDTVAGTESGSDGGGGANIVGGFSIPADARQAEAEPLVAASSLPSSGDGGGFGGTDTAAGGDGGGDLGSTETAAGGGGTPDTQAPIAPVNVPTTPGLTTPI